MTESSGGSSSSGDGYQHYADGKKCSSQIIGGNCYADDGSVDNTCSGATLNGCKAACTNAADCAYISFFPSNYCEMARASSNCDDAANREDNAGSQIWGPS